MKDSSANGQIRVVVRILSKYNLVIFIVIIAAGLVASILMFTNIINKPYESSATAGSSNTTFDQGTINSLSTLEFSSKNSNYKNLPAGRISPFSE